jgi:hypothetical protein
MMAIGEQLEQRTNGWYSRWLSQTDSPKRLFAHVGTLDVWEAIHLALTPSEIEAEVSRMDETFTAACVPFAVDLGCNYFVLTDTGAVTYLDYTGFYSPQADSVNVYPVAQTFERFASEARSGVVPPAGSRAGYLLQADAQRDGGTRRDEIWHFAGRSLQCIERVMFTRFFVAKYRP